MRRAITPFAILVLFGSGACRRDPVFREMSDSTYIRTMVALRKLPLNPADPTSRARQRDSILNANGVTAEEIEAIAIRLSEDPARAAEIFRAIENPVTGAPP